LDRGAGRRDFRPGHRVQGPYRREVHPRGHVWLRPALPGDWRAHDREVIAPPAGSPGPARAASTRRVARPRTNDLQSEQLRRDAPSKGDVMTRLPRVASTGALSLLWVGTGGAGVSGNFPGYVARGGGGR